MSEKLFEIAFSGQIADGADLQSVKLKIAKIFKADEDRLAQMFSGRRVLIKRQADEITMVKYRGAFQKAGAICEIVNLSGGVDINSYITISRAVVPREIGTRSLMSSDNLGSILLRRSSTVRSCGLYIG